MFFYTKKKLASEIILLLKENNPDLNLEYIESENKIKSDDGYTHLDNIYPKVKKMSKKDRIIWLKQFLYSGKQKTDNIFPVIRLKSQIDATNQYQIMDEKHYIFSMPFSASKKHVIVLVFNQENKFEYVINSALEDLKLSKEDAFEIALKNLSNSFESSSLTKVMDGLYESDINIDSEFEPSRLLLESFDKVALKGKPVVFMLQKNNIYLCGSEDHLAFEAINILYEKSKEEGFFLSEFPLIFDDNVWKDFIPDNHNIHNQIKIGRLNEYTSTKDFIDAYNDKEGIDTFLAKYKLYNVEGQDTYQSYTTVTETVFSWIPESEYISFVSFENETPELMGSISWDTAMSNFKEYFTPIEGEPKRYEINKFPPKDILIQYIED